MSRIRVCSAQSFRNHGFRTALWPNINTPSSWPPSCRTAVPSTGQGAAEETSVMHLLSNPELWVHWKSSHSKDARLSSFLLVVLVAHSISYCKRGTRRHLVQLRGSVMSSFAHISLEQTGHPVIRWSFDLETQLAVICARPFLS